MVLMSSFLGALGFYVVKFIFIVAVAICGIFIGASLRKKKDAKLELETSQSNNQED